MIAIAFLSNSFSSTNADPNPSSFENWKTDFSKTTIDLNEVLSGGPPKDGIPAIDEPKFISISEAELTNQEPVIAFEHNGDARAYPLSVLIWHEIVNDVVGNHPFAVTYCPLCNAAIVFDANFEGGSLDFGTTGRLRNSDLLMYDRQSETWWQQFSGEGVIGKHSGKSLKIVPSRLESWESFKQRFPQGRVLIPNNNSLRNYGRNPYVNYDSRDAPYPLYQGSLPDDINPMARVIVLRRNGVSISILSMAKVREAGTLELDGFSLSWKEGRASALDSAKIANGRDIGNLVVTELIDGEIHDSVHDITFAFVAHAFHPELKIIQ